MHAAIGKQSAKTLTVQRVRAPGHVGGLGAVSACDVLLHILAEGGNVLPVLAEVGVHTGVLALADDGVHRTGVGEDELVGWPLPVVRCEWGMGQMIRGV